jgi:protein-tyrosine phosphatase
MPVSDLHVHLLPGLDDGPRDEGEAIALAGALAADGVGLVAATPHIRADYPDIRPEELGARTAALQAVLEREAIDLEIVPAGEVALEWALNASDEELRLVSFAQRGEDLLVETPYGPVPSAFEHLLFQVAERGYRILLAHPERNRSFHRQPERLAALAEAGILLQPTASALASTARRSQTRRLARDLVLDGHAHVIASDAHGATQRAPLSAGVAAAAELAPERARWMVEDVPRAILSGDPLPEAPEDPKARRRSLLHRLLRRSGAG